MKGILTRTFHSWTEGDPFSRSAAAAYYALFSLPGIIMVIIAVATLALDQAYVRTQFLGSIEQNLGSDISTLVEAVIDNTKQQNRSIWAMAIGLATLVFGATGLFAQLQQDFNKIMDVRPSDESGVRSFIKQRLRALGAILAMGLLLIASFLITICLSIISNVFTDNLSGLLQVLFQLLDFFASFTIMTLVFGVMYKILPATKIEWRPALMGGVVSCVLFTIGKYLITIYFKFTEPASAFGATGSIVLLMLWMSYLGLILLFGAHFVKTYTSNESQK